MSVFRTNGVDSIEVEENKAVFIKAQNSAETSAMYTPSLLGGSVQFTTDVSQIDCGCVSGAYLVQTGAECGEDPLTGEPTCPNIEIMQANKFGFNTNVSGTCALKMKEDGINNYDQFAYGPNGTLIDTNFEFTVKTEFISDENYTAAFKVRTTLSQGTGELTMQADCANELADLYGALDGTMGLVLSHWDDSADQITDIELTCPTRSGCRSGGYNKFRKLQFAQDGSTEADDGGDGDGDGDGGDGGEKDLIDVGPASSIDMCGEGCTACHMMVDANNAAAAPEYQCMDQTLFNYNYKCGSRKDRSLCGADDLCHWAYPYGDADKNKSVDAKCRPIPKKFIEGPFKFARRECRKSTWGLCNYGCGTAPFKNSWLIEDEGKWNGYSTMCRCAV